MASLTIAGVNRSIAPGPMRCRVAGPETIGHWTTTAAMSVRSAATRSTCSAPRLVPHSATRLPSASGNVRTTSIAAWRS